MTGAEAVYGLMGLGLFAWLMTGGADLGGGVVERWVPPALQTRARAAVEKALAPIWEANHVWLIFVVVLLFTAFPKAFAVVSVAFHWPLLLALLGLVARGAAFTFRAYGLDPSATTQERYSRVFTLASAGVPVVLGMVLAGSASGAVVVENGRVTSSLSAGWATSFGLSVGAFTLSLCALLAAVYLTLATQDDDELVEVFRRRGLQLEAIAGALAAVTVWRASADASAFFERLSSTTLTAPWQAVTALSALGCVVALAKRKYSLARVAVGAQVLFVFVGFAAAMRGDLLLGAMSLAQAGTQQATLDAVAPGLVVGTLVLAPALVWLYRTFRAPARPTSDG